ncbi:MAG: phage/plasmid primase, P4 family [Candidatus Nitrosocosmicus sp.]
MNINSINTNNNYNDWADFWYHERGSNVFPYDTKNRIPILGSHKEYQYKRIPNDVFEGWKSRGLFEKGMAIFPGKLYLDISENDNNSDSLYLVAIDLDKKEAIEEFCNLNGKNITLKELAEKTILEQHEDNLDRAHIYLLSPIPFPGKGSDSKIGIEVKSKAEHGIMFCCPSLHKNGHRYQIIGIKEPCILDKTQAIEMIQHINSICKKYGLEYIEKKTEISLELRKIVKTLRIKDNVEIALLEGERHNRLISIGNSLLFRHYNEDEDGTANAAKLKTFFEEINLKFCKPEPIPQVELDTIWNSCIKFIRAHKDFTFNNRKQQAKIDLIEEATELILQDNHFLTLEETKEILHYRKGVYVPGGEIIIEKEAENIFGYDLANKHLSEIKGHIIRKTYHKREELDADINIINLQNGLYNISKDKLNPHTPNYLSVNQKPIVFNPNMKPKYFWKFLRDVLYPNEIKTAVEAMAYTFYRDTPFEYFFKLFGYGSNGKSVFTGLLTKLHDDRNISNVSISALLDNRFALSDLEFKDVNIDTELTNAVIKDTTILKKLTGGRKQPIRIERKNQNAYDTHLHAKLFFNANVIRESLDQTAAYYRREVLISFPFTFEGGRDDPYLLQRLSSENELAGIFNILMTALRRILKNNGIFLNEKTVEQKRKKSERANDPVKVFLEEAVAEDSTADEWITKSELHQAYIRFCNKYKLAFKSIEAFGKDLKRLRPTISEGKRSKQDERRKTCWFGIRLTPEYQLDIGKQQQITFSINDMSGLS